MSEEFDGYEDLDSTEPSKISGLKSDKIQPDRMTLILNIHHEPYRDQIYSIDPIIVEIPLDTKEEHYSRRRTIGEDWVDVGLGHFNSSDEVGLVVIENIEGPLGGRKPTAQEWEQLKKKILEVSPTGKQEDATVHLPCGRGVPYIAYPKDASRLRMRSWSGQLKVRVHLFPR